MQFCCNLGHLDWMRIGDDSSYTFLADKLVSEHWQRVQRQCLGSFNSLHLSCVFSKFSSKYQPVRRKDPV